MEILGHIRLAILRQQGHLLLWAPVCLGLGIGVFFLLKFEPAVLSMAVLGIAGAGLLTFSRFMGEVPAPPTRAIALILLGVALAATRAHLVADPVLSFRYYGPVEGRIVAIDRSASDVIRLTLADVRLDRVARDRTPGRVRVALHGDQRFLTPKPGQLVGMTAHLAPPSGPAEPGGFDFQRHAWFLGIGAVGYTRVPALALAPPPDAPSIFATRMALSAAVQSNLPGETGAFAAAVTTGDRSAMSQATIETLRRSNLAHLLAISGLHMGLLAGFVFAAIRLGLALVPRVSLRIPAKKVAAVGAFLAAAGYLALSGGSVATERAFIMSAVALGAVLVDRRALSLRAVAIAALIVLVLRPEALMSPGFQMSFAATTALVAVFRFISDNNIRLGPPVLRPVVAVVISSLVAGLATAPIAAAHFNQIAHYGLIANLLSVPVMGAVVVPAAVLAACLSPIGLEGLGLAIMGLGLDWILWVAAWVSGLDGARGAVMAPPAWVLPVFCLGAVFAVIWQGKERVAGAVPMIVALAFWGTADRPAILIADTGGLVGVMTAEGRALSRDKGQGFVARIWLENDGDAVDQPGAAHRWPETGALRRFAIPGGTLIHVHGKRALAGFTGCAPGDLVVFSMEYDQPLPCASLGPKVLAQSGAVAIKSRGSGFVQATARQVSGARLWNTRATDDR